MVTFGKELTAHFTLCKFHLSFLTDHQGLLFPLKTALLFRGLVGKWNTGSLIAPEKSSRLNRTAETYIDVLCLLPAPQGKKGTFQGQRQFIGIFWLFWFNWRKNKIRKGSRQKGKGIVCGWKKLPLAYSFWSWIWWLVVCESTIFQMCFVMKRLLQEAGEKKPCSEQDADSSPKMVTQPLRCTCPNALALSRQGQRMCSCWCSLPPALHIPASC